MGKKSLIISEKARLMDVRWMNTPFAFAQLGKDLTLLQMQVLLKVSEHLQDYLNQFFKSGRNLSPEDPLSLFDDRTLADIPTIKIPYNDFDVPVNNRAALYAAIKEVLHLSIKALYFNENGEPIMRWTNVLSQVETPMSSLSDSEYRNGYLELKINRDVAAYAFNMNLGYINHPNSLASDSLQVYAPHLYFLIKHKIRKTRFNIDINYEELREELGMNPRPQNDDDHPTVRYPKFSEFKNKVLEPAVADINRMAEHNLLDITVRYEINYPRGLTRGNPTSITFKVALSKLGEYHKDPKAARAHMDVSTGQGPTQLAPRRRGRPRKVVANDNDTQQTIVFPEHKPTIVIGEKSELWAQLVAEYADGPLSGMLAKATYIGTERGAFHIQMPDYNSRNELVSAIGHDARFKSMLAKYLPDQFEMFRIRVSFAE